MLFSLEFVVVVVVGSWFELPQKIFYWLAKNGNFCLPPSLSFSFMLAHYFLWLCVCFHSLLVIYFFVLLLLFCFLIDLIWCVWGAKLSELGRWKADERDDERVVVVVVVLKRFCRGLAVSQLANGNDDDWNDGVGWWDLLGTVIKKVLEKKVNVAKVMVTNFVGEGSDFFNCWAVQFFTAK